MSDHTIFIRAAEAGTGFSVQIDPPLRDADYDREFDTHKEAYGYAGGFRLVKGWPVTDTTGHVPGVGMFAPKGGAA